MKFIDRVEDNNNSCLREKCFKLTYFFLKTIWWKFMPVLRTGWNNVIDLKPLFFIFVMLNNGYLSFMLQSTCEQIVLRNVRPCTYSFVQLNISNVKFLMEFFLLFYSSQRVCCKYLVVQPIYMIIDC